MNTQIKNNNVLNICRRECIIANTFFWDGNMADSARKQSFAEIDRAGKPLREAWNLRDQGDTSDDFDWSVFLKSWLIATQWRERHSYPLSQIRHILKRLLAPRYPNAFLAQRLKGVPSIIDKLVRKTHMRLSQMQDIGGCRIVLDDKKQVEEVVRMLEERGVAHPLHNKKDYTQNPKHSGYRSVHLIYNFKGKKTHTFDDIRIEVQVRTAIQHGWSAAVELFGELEGMAFKKDTGDPQWRRFFALMGSVGAREENLPYVPYTGPDIKAVTAEIKTINNQYRIYDKLKQYQLLPFTEMSDNPNGYYFLITTDYKKREAIIKGFERTDLLAAERAYQETELEYQKDNLKKTILVSVDSFDSLKKAYPNFFGDAWLFMNQVDETFKLLADR